MFVYNLYNKTKKTERRFKEWNDVVAAVKRLASECPNDQIEIEEIDLMAKGSARQVLGFYTYKS